MRANAKKAGIAHALCWSHHAVSLLKAQSTEPQVRDRGSQAHQRALRNRDDIRMLGLCGEAKMLHRLTHSKPHVETFFAWVERRLETTACAPPRLYQSAELRARAAARAGNLSHRCRRVDGHQSFGAQSACDSDGPELSKDWIMQVFSQSTTSPPYAGRLDNSAFSGCRGVGAHDVRWYRETTNLA